MCCVFTKNIEKVLNGGDNQYVSLMVSSLLDVQGLERVYPSSLPMEKPRCLLTKIHFIILNTYMGPSSTAFKLVYNMYGEILTMPVQLKTLLYIHGS